MPAPEAKQRQQIYMRLYDQKRSKTPERIIYLRERRKAPRTKLLREKWLKTPKGKIYSERHRIQDLERLRKRGKTPEAKLYQKNYRQNPKRKLHMRKYTRLYQRKWRAKNRLHWLIYMRKWRAKNPEKLRAYLAKYEGKGFIPLTSNIWGCQVEWHHISPDQPYVVPIPRELHQSFLGKRHHVVIASFIPMLFGLNLETSPPFVPV